MGNQCREYEELLKILAKEKNTDEEYTDIIAKITMNDERFKKIIIAYYNMSANKKDLLCDFFENFIL